MKLWLLYLSAIDGHELLVDVFTDEEDAIDKANESSADGFDARLVAGEFTQTSELKI